MVHHDKISLIREYALCVGLKIIIRGETVYILNPNTKHYEFVCYSVYNHSYHDLLDIINNFCTARDILGGGLKAWK